jgi:integrase
MRVMAGRDTKTRTSGVFARHKQRCALNADRSARCNCRPSYFGVCWDTGRRRPVKTRMMPSIEAARSARVDLQRKLDEGELPVETGIRFHEARERFVAAAREGRALNKHGHRYKQRALDDIEECLRVHAEPRLGSKRLAQIRRGDVQTIVDELAPTMSGSRVRSVVNAIRSLYRWAQDRDLAGHDPAALARLPAMDATAIERVASPAEFARLLGVLSTEDALPCALAGYGMARRAQIVRVRWQDVDLNLGAIEWGVEWEARKYQASRRVVPTVPPLLALLNRAYLEQGRPDGSQLVCPPRYVAKTGVLSAPGLAQRARSAWKEAGLRPITLQEARHTAATWLDAAGVSPKVASYLMGHSTPARQYGAADITLRRYTHTLPEDIEQARKTLARYLADRHEERAAR